MGRLENLHALGFAYFSCKLEPEITEEVYYKALEKLQTVEACSLYLNSAVVASLPIKCSRHNTPSRCHTITRMVQTHCSNMSYLNKNIVIVCVYADMFASGCAIARAFTLYNKKSRNEKTINVNVEFVVLDLSTYFPNGEGTDQRIKHDLLAIEYAGYGINLSARITDTPCNEMHVDEFLKEINDIAHLLNIKPTIIRGKQLLERGFGGIYNVGKASPIAPALAILSYTSIDAKINIALVGKGIVFDTGGLSLKPRMEMVRMKNDCGGAASILGAFYALVMSRFSQNLHAIFCIAENTIGPLAMRPDDIHTLYSKKTVEINNTDAEGRLVLADGVVYAKRTLNCDVILDMATLTGSQLTSTGKYHAALLTNNGEWENYCMQAGRISGDLVFPIPFVPELHMPEFDSVFADVKNSTVTNNASTSCAGLFIGYHLGFDYPGTWIHVDMAGTVRNGEKATGYGVAFLCTLFGGFCKQNLLNTVAPPIQISE